MTDDNDNTKDEVYTAKLEPLSWTPTHIIVVPNKRNTKKEMAKGRFDDPYDVIPVARVDRNYPGIGYAYTHMEWPGYTTPTAWKLWDGKWYRYGELTSCVVYEITSTGRVTNQVVATATA